MSLRNTILSISTMSTSSAMNCVTEAHLNLIMITTNNPYRYSYVHTYVGTYVDHAVNFLFLLPFYS